MLNRRLFLKGTGGLFLALPFLESPLLHAANPTGIKRFIVFVHGQGTLTKEWKPTSYGSQYTMPEILSPLEPIRQHLNILSGINNEIRPTMRAGNAHNPAGRSLLTCSPFAGCLDKNGKLKSTGHPDNGNSYFPSIDQVVAEKIQNGTPLRSLNLNVGGDNLAEYTMMWEGKPGSVRLVKGVGNPETIYDRLFKNMDPDRKTPQQILRNAHTPVLDAVKSDFDKLSSKLGAADRARLEQHANLVEKLEQRLKASTDPTASCNPEKLVLPANYNFSQDAFADTSSRLQIQSLVTAMACDLTRVGTLQYTNYDGPRFQHRTLPKTIPVMPHANWHAMIHDGRNDPKIRPTIRKAFQFFAEEFAYLIKQLGSTLDVDGKPLLDNTLVLWMSEFGNGGIHSTSNLPVIVAGGPVGKTGQHLDFSQYNTNELFTSIAQKFGRQESHFGLKLEHNGDPFVKKIPSLS